MYYDERSRLIVREEVQNERTNTIVKKTHWWRNEWDGTDTVVFIHRDPRDVVISQIYYRSQQPTDKVMRGTISQICERYEGYVREWLADTNAVPVRYEWLHQRPVRELQKVCLKIFGAERSERELKELVDRHAFKKWSAKFPHSMRKGVIGDWTSHYNRAHGKLIDNCLGKFMMDMGYISSRDWWKALPE